MMNGFRAVTAARYAKYWGRQTTKTYLEYWGISPRLYRIARQCEAMKKINRRMYD